ncbi:MAG: hypothetical protein ACRDGQ_05520 [Candidatus Limnocylindrales bacterium]
MAPHKTRTPSPGHSEDHSVVVKVTFDGLQYRLIERLRNEGVLGSDDASVVRNGILEYLRAQPERR